MKISHANIPDILIIEPKVFTDKRGFFLESWNKKTFNQCGIHANFVQDNHSFSKQGTLRGLHYQIAKPQAKLVRITQGEVFEVVVDIRQSSPYFAKWFGINLSSEEQKMLWIPPGFAHGFYVKSEVAECQYKCTEYYNANTERCIHWSDSTINIKWPFTDESHLLISSKDKNGKSLIEAEVFE